MGEERGKDIERGEREGRWERREGRTLREERGKDVGRGEREGH